MKIIWTVDVGGRTYQELRDNAETELTRFLGGDPTDVELTGMSLDCHPLAYQRDGRGVGAEVVSYEATASIRIDL